MLFSSGDLGLAFGPSTSWAQMRIRPYGRVFAHIIAVFAHMVAASAHVVPALAHMGATVAHMVTAPRLEPLGLPPVAATSSALFSVVLYELAKLL